MPWVRIDENAMDHPKFLALPDGAWRLWCEGQAYCQKHLTDGVIPSAALRGFRYYSPSRVRHLTAETVPGKGPCWHQEADGSIRVHDYLDWNDSREAVLQARGDARERRRRWRQRHASQDASPDADETASVVRGVACRGTAGEVSTESGGGAGEGKKPARLAYADDVLEVPRFLDSEFRKRLNGTDFDLAGFYTRLSERLQRTGDRWDLQWIRDQFDAESPAPERRRAPRDRERPFTAEERRNAERLRRNVWANRCRHEERCETAAGCVALIIRELRAREEQPA